MLACALVAPPLLLPLRGRAWSVPFAAPLMGVALLAGAYPALAGQARTLWRRAALGALGFWMLVLAEPVVHETLYYGRARGTRARQRLGGLAARRRARTCSRRCSIAACSPARRCGRPRAAVLPWLVRGRSAALDLVAATLWAAGLAAGAGAIGHALGAGVGAAAGSRAAPRSAAAAAVLIAVAARAVRGADAGGDASARIGSAGAAVA